MQRCSIRLSNATLAFVAFSATVMGYSAATASECKRVQGHLEETLATAGCTSPVGFCTVGRMFGNLQGEARFTASAIIPSADTPNTSVVFVTGDTILVDATLGGSQGTLSIKNASAFRTVGEGDLADVQTIIGGTGDFAGASGSLRTSGTFVDTSGTSTFEGVVCLP